MVDYRVTKDSKEPRLNRIAASFETVGVWNCSSVCGLKDVFCLGTISDFSFKKCKEAAALISQAGYKFRHGRLLIGIILERLKCYGN
jgi:hypothetical protein